MKSHAKRSFGFTIVELMMVLAVSGMLLIVALVTFSGQTKRTGFTQAMYDLQSKYQSFSTQSSSSSLAGLENYSCHLDASGFPELVTPPDAADVTGNCIYLGKAIQVRLDQNTIYAYPVFGIRTTAAGTTPTVLSEAKPEPALDDSTPSKFLGVETYQLLNGLKVSSAKAGPSTGTVPSYLVTLYGNLRDINTSGKEITAYAWPIGSVPAMDPWPSQIRFCIEENTTQGSPCNDSSAIPLININQPWKLCVWDGQRKAELSLYSTATGITTQLDMNGCT